jgi:hypothetical protein
VWLGRRMVCVAREENGLCGYGREWFVWLGRRMVCVTREGNGLCGWEEIGLCG